MPDVNVKMGVTGLGQYKSAMTQLESITKRTDSALKLSEKQFKQTGDAEEYMAQKSGNLKLKLSAQQQMIKATQQAMAQLTEQGVDPLSKRYQDLERKLQDTQSAMIDTQQQIAELGQTSTTATGQTDKLEKSLSGLNKKVSLEQVVNGIKGITSAMENAVRMAGRLGTAIWTNITDSARWADDTATAASILGMDVEEYQKYARTFETIGDITVADWMNAKRRIQSAIYSPTSDQVDIFAALGISTHTMQQGKYGIVEGAARDYEDILWEVGKDESQEGESELMFTPINTTTSDLPGNTVSLVGLSSVGYREGGFQPTPYFKYEENRLYTCTGAREPNSQAIISGSTIPVDIEEEPEE